MMSTRWRGDEQCGARPRAKGSKVSWVERALLHRVRPGGRSFSRASGEEVYMAMYIRVHMDIIYAGRLYICHIADYAQTRARWACNATPHGDGPWRRKRVGVTIVCCAADAQQPAGSVHGNGITLQTRVLCVADHRGYVRRGAHGLTLQRSGLTRERPVCECGISTGRRGRSVSTPSRTTPSWDGVCARSTTSWAVGPKWASQRRR